MLEDFWRDASVAIRMLRRAPLFAATAIITVGLGVGVNTLVFSVVEGLVLRPLPIEQPERVWFVQRRGPFVSHSFPLYRELRDRNRTFAGLAGYRITMMNVETPRGRFIRGATWPRVDFDLLGLKPFRGRLFQASDDVAPGGSPYAVLSSTTGARCSARRIRDGFDHPHQPAALHGPRSGACGISRSEVFYRPAIWVPMM